MVGACTGAADTISSAPDSGVTTESTTTSTVVASPPFSLSPPPDHPIGVRLGSGGGELYDRRSEETFVMRGVNYTIRAPVGRGFENRVFAVDVWDPERFATDVQSLVDRGYNTVRLWIDSCSDGAACLTQTGVDGLNTEYLDNLSEGIRIAKEHDIFLLLTSNDIPDGGGYGTAANATAGGQFAGYRNAHFLTAAGVEAATRYWQDILAALRERDAPTDTVVAWSLLNEMWVFEDQPPLSLDSGEVIAANGETYDMASEEGKRRLVADGFNHYIATVGAAIIDMDPTALVTTGFFHPKFPHPSRLGDSWYVDTASLLESASLDFFDFHAYPGVELTLQEYTENFGAIGYTEKPVIMGEVGAFQFAYGSPAEALPAIARFIADSCELGWDGWLYWEYYRPDAASDSTWGFTDDNGLLMDALAPVNQADACDASEMAPKDLAHGQDIAASQEIADEPATHAVDGAIETIWGAGAGPPQWIEVTLETSSTVSEVALLTSQYPEGFTRHRVLGRLDDGALVPLGEIAGDTVDDQWLRLSEGGPWNGVAAVRVETVESPSWVGWREIQVLGE